MKFSRDKNIIRIEVEAKDCPPGYDVEMIADAFMTGMQVMDNSPDFVPQLIQAIYSRPELAGRYEGATKDFMERWEMGGVYEPPR